MKRVVFGLLVLGLLTVPAHASSLKLTISDGKVSIDAQDVTIRQILSEWARLGQTKIINLERLTSGPITLKLDNVPEKEALETLLRNVPGYMAAPRASYVPGASFYDRILIMATTSTPPPVTGRSPAPFPSPLSPNVTQLRGVPSVMTPGVLPEPPSDGPAESQEDAAIAAAAAAGLVTVPALMPPPTALTPGPPFMPPPGSAQSPGQAQPATPRQTTPSNPWNAPAGAARPGLAPPPPPAPATPLPPNQRPRPPQADR